MPIATEQRGTIAGFAVLCIAGACTWCTFGPAWSWPAEIFHGPARASGIALFNTCGAAGMPLGCITQEDDEHSVFFLHLGLPRYSTSSGTMSVNAMMNPKRRLTLRLSQVMPTCTYLCKYLVWKLVHLCPSYEASNSLFLGELVDRKSCWTLPEHIPCKHDGPS